MPLVRDPVRVLSEHFRFWIFSGTLTVSQNMLDLAGEGV